MGFYHESDNNCCFIPPGQYSLLSALIGILLIDNLSLEQQNAYGNFLVNVGQSLLTAAAQGQAIESGSNNSNMRKQLELLKKQLSEFGEEIDRIEKEL